VNNNGAPIILAFFIFTNIKARKYPGRYQNERSTEGACSSVSLLVSTAKHPYIYLNEGGFTIKTWD
jgi:hypothetical protein